MNATIVRVGKLTRHLFFTAIALIMAFPFYWMVTSALKTNDEIWQSPPTIWPKDPLWSNFSAAWHEAPFFRYMGNSIFVAVSIVILQVINSGMMAYALTHMKFRFRGLFSGVILSAIWFQPPLFIFPDIWYCPSSIYWIHMPD